MQLSTLEREMLRKLRKQQQSHRRSHISGILIGLLFVVVGVLVLAFGTLESDFAVVLISPLEESPSPSQSRLGLSVQVSGRGFDASS